MNLRWLLGNFTDPQYQLPRREQFKLSNEAHRRFVSKPAFYWRSALLLIPFLVLLQCVEPALGWLGYAGQPWPHIAADVILVVLFWVWSAWMFRSLYVRPIRLAMREAGYDLCINCGYELRGLDGATTRCPECGAALDARPTASPCSTTDPAAE